MINSPHDCSGLISSVLVPHTRKIIGVDVSEAMVGEFNKKIVSQGLSKEKMSGVVVELKGEDSELEGEKFDFVVVCAISFCLCHLMR